MPQKGEQNMEVLLCKHPSKYVKLGARVVAPKVESRLPLVTGTRRKHSYAVQEAEFRSFQRESFPWFGGQDVTNEAVFLLCNSA